MQPMRGELGAAPVPAAATGGDMVAEQEVVEQERAVDSAEGQISAAKVVAAADRRESSPPTSKLSIGKMNPRAPGWNKRMRIGDAAPCPDRVSAFENTVPKPWAKPRAAQHMQMRLLASNILSANFIISSWMCPRAVAREV